MLYFVINVYDFEQIRLAFINLITRMKVQVSFSAGHPRQVLTKRCKSTKSVGHTSCLAQGRGASHKLFSSGILNRLVGQARQAQTSVIHQLGHFVGKQKHIDNIDK